MVRESKGVLSDRLVSGDVEEGSNKTELDLEGRLCQLEISLEQKGVMCDPKGQKQLDGTTQAGTGQAVKLSSEFLAAVVVGAALGVGLDRLTDLSPWSLVVFLMLGFAAGVLNILRAVGAVRSYTIGQNNKGTKLDN